MFQTTGKAKMLLQQIKVSAVIDGWITYDFTSFLPVFRPLTFVSHLVLVNHFGGLSLPRNSVRRLADCPKMTIAVCT